MHSPGLCLPLLSRAEKAGPQLDQPTREDPCLPKWVAAARVCTSLPGVGDRGGKDPPPIVTVPGPGGARPMWRRQKDRMRETERHGALSLASWALNKSLHLPGPQSWGPE